MRLILGTRHAQSDAIHRIVWTVSAQLYNQFVTVLSQLVTIPFLLSAWGLDRYGAWLIIAAIPTYLTLSDFGFTFIAKNLMVIHAMDGNSEEVVAIYNSTLVLLTFSSIIILALSDFIIYHTSLLDNFSLSLINFTFASEALLTLILNTLLTQIFLLLCAGVRASGRPAAEVTWAATARLLEAIAMVSAADFSTNIAVAARSMLLSRLCVTILLWAWLRWRYPILVIDFTKSKLNTVRSMLNPSISYMFVSLSQAITIHGPTLVLGWAGKPSDAVLYVSARTLTRLGTAAGNLVNFSLSPEYSRSFATKNRRMFDLLFYSHMTVGIIGVTIYACGLFFAGPWLFNRWTHGHVALDRNALIALTLAVSAEMIWSAMFTSIAAINQHVRLSYYLSLLSVIGLIASYPTARSFGVAAVAWILFIIHLIMCLVVCVAHRARNQSKHAFYLG